MFLSAQRASGAPAYPYPIDLQQPDGSVITVRLYGDEWVNRRTTLDDYTMLVNDEGELEYAILDEYGDLQLSGVRARNERERTDEEKKFLQKHPKNLKYGASQIDIMRQMRAVRDEAQEEIRQAPVSGTVRVPIILAEFSDKRFQKTKEQFEILFNQINYTDNGRIPGSLNDYFYLNSYGKFNLQVDVYGPYALPNPISYYDHNGTGGRGAGAKMARAAVQAAIRSGCDFSNYPDPASSINAIAVHIIFAGYGQEAGAAANTAIWSHSSSFVPVINNSKTISKYSCSPELRGNSGTTITSIGVIAHELGHSVLGLHDYYDTNDDDDGNAVDLGPWCLMANGSWNGRGDIPAFLSAQGRLTVGWAALILLDSPQDVTMPNPINVPLQAVYRINTATNNEYFLFENRQRIGWENSSIPASGMLIYHVDRAGVNWSLTANKINADASRRGYYVKQAGCSAPDGCPASANNPRSNDVFPRNKFNAFTDTSIPDSKSYAGVNTDKPVTDITLDEYKRTVTFKFMGGEPAVPVRSYGKIYGKYGVSFEKNVVSNAAKIYVRTPENAIVNIVISDNIGNTVFETSGKNGDTFVWNLTNNAGRTVANGAYLVIVEAKGKSGKVYSYYDKIGVKR